MKTYKYNLSQGLINFCVIYDASLEKSEVLKKYYSNLEKEINSLGGIANKKIKIWLVDVVPLDEKRISSKDFFLTNNKFDFVLMNAEADFHDKNLQPNEKYDQEIYSMLFQGNDHDFINKWYKYFKYKYSLDTFSSAGGYKAILDLFPGYKITALIHESKKSRQKEFDDGGLNTLYYKKNEEVRSIADEYFKKQSRKDLFYLSGLIFPAEDVTKRIDQEAGAELGGHTNSDDEIDVYEETLNSYFASDGDGELFDGGGQFYSDAKRTLASKENVKNKSVHCYAPLDYLVYMRSQDLLKNIDKSLPSWELSQIDTRLGPASIIPMLKELFANSTYDFESREDFLKEAVRRINTVDGKRDIHRGDFLNIAFNKNNEMHSKGKYTLDLSVGKDGQTIKERLSRFQKIDWNSDDPKTIKPVTYTYFDVINVCNISIEEGTFEAQFFLDMTSRHDDPLKTISFNNLDLKSELKTRVIKEQLMDDEFKFVRYLVEAKFDFFPIVENYPFDSQLVFISYALIDEEKYGVLQPLPVEELDTDFRLEGWRIKDMRSGVFRRKININPFLSDSGEIKIERENRVGWLIKRSSSMTLLKVLIPLAFLFGVVMYSAAMPSEDIGRAAELLTITFLASIALYFSSERPQPLTMTIIDIIFASFYTITGIVSLFVFVLDFYPEIHSTLSGYLSFIVPGGTFLMFAYLLRRIKSRKYVPKMLSADEN